MKTQTFKKPIPKNQILVLSLFIILLICSFYSCKKEKKAVDISIFQTISATEQWAVVKDSYVAFYSEADKTAPIQANGRKGDILEIQGEKWLVKKNIKEKWFLFENGWLEESSISIYANALQAKKASENLVKE